MARQGKLRTRKSTLGATRDERIESAMSSLAGSSIYDKGNNRRFPSVMRTSRGWVHEQRDEVPKSITSQQLEQQRRGQSLLRDPPPEERVEMVAMENDRGRPFVRILVSRTSRRAKAVRNLENKTLPKTNLLQEMAETHNYRATTHPRAIRERRDDVNDIHTPNYYGIHSLKKIPKVNSRRKLFSFNKATDEQTTWKQQRKQKRIRKRLDKEAKNETQEELERHGVKRNNSLTHKITYVPPTHTMQQRNKKSLDSLEGSKNQSVSMEDRIPGSVSYVSSRSNEDILSRNTEAIQIEMSGSLLYSIGNAFAFSSNRDVRDLRMVESDISSSDDDYQDDRSESSSEHCYNYNQF